MVGLSFVFDFLWNLWKVNVLGNGGGGGWGYVCRVQDGGQVSVDTDGLFVLVNSSDQLGIVRS